MNESLALILGTIITYVIIRYISNKTSQPFVVIPEMINAVQQIFPNIPESVIRRELEQTRSVQLTIDSLLSRTDAQDSRSPAAFTKSTIDPSSGIIEEV